MNPSFASTGIPAVPGLVLAAPTFGDEAFLKEQRPARWWRGEEAERPLQASHDLPVITKRRSTRLRVPGAEHSPVWKWLPMPATVLAVLMPVLALKFGNRVKEWLRHSRAAESAASSSADAGKDFDPSPR